MYTIPEAARFLDVHESSIEDYVSDGKLRVSFIGRERIVSDDEMRVFLRKYRSVLPTIEEMAESFGVSREVVYYAFRRKHNVEPDAMNGQKYCYGMKSIRYVMDKEGWLHGSVAYDDESLQLAVFRNGLWNCLDVEDDLVHVLIMSANRNVLKLNKLYTIDDVAEICGASRRTLRDWLYSGKIKASGKTPKGEFVWTEKDLAQLMEWLNPCGWSMSDLSELYGVSMSTAWRIIEANPFMPIGHRLGGGVVYDHKEMMLVMEELGHEMKNTRIYQASSEVKPEDEGWFVVVIDRKSRSLHIANDRLVTLSEAKDIEDGLNQEDLKGLQDEEQD